MISITLIKNSKINIDVCNIDSINCIDLDLAAHKDFVKAKKLLYKWGNPKLPFCVIEDGKKTLDVIYSENEEITKERILSKLNL